MCVCVRFQKLLLIHFANVLRVVMAYNQPTNQPILYSNPLRHRRSSLQHFAANATFTAIAFATATATVAATTFLLAACYVACWCAQTKTKLKIE